MFSKIHKTRVLREAEEKQQELKPVCELHMDRIFALLHVKALDSVKNKNIKIENTAVEGEDEKTAKFHGAGEFMITARALEEGGKIKKADALASIKEYVGAFLGPDLVAKLTEDVLQALPSSDDGDKTKGAEDGDNEDDNEDEVDEAGVFNLSFSRFLAEDDDPEHEDKDDDPEHEDKDDDPEHEDKDDDPDADGGDNDGDDTEGDSDPDNDEEDGDPDDDEGDDDPDADDDDEDPEDDPEEKQPEETPDNSDGYGIVYRLGIKGQPEHKLRDTLKDFASEFTQNFGIRLINGWGQAGETHKLKEITSDLGTIFGNIDLDTFIPAYKANIEKKFKEGANYISVEGWDVEVVKRYCKEWLTAKDLKLLLAKGVKYAVCTRIQKSEKTPELYTSKVVAEVMTKSMASFFKQMKRGIKPEDIIKIKNYAENERSKEDRKLNKRDADREEAATPDEDWSDVDDDSEVSEGRASIDVGRMLFECFNNTCCQFGIDQTEVNTRLFENIFGETRESDIRMLSEADEERPEDGETGSEKPSDEDKDGDDGEKPKTYTLTFVRPEDPAKPDSGKFKPIESIEPKEIDAGMAVDLDEYYDVEAPAINGYAFIEWQLYSADGKKKLGDEINADQDMISMAVYVNSEKIAKKLIDILGKKYSEYTMNVKKDRSFERKVEQLAMQNKKLHADMKIGKIDLKKGSDIKIEDWLKIVEQLKKAPKLDDAKKAVDAFGVDFVNDTLNLSGNGFSRSKNDNSQIFSNHTEWFMYIVPMPGARYKSEDGGPEREGKGDY